MIAISILGMFGALLLAYFVGLYVGVRHGTERAEEMIETLQAERADLEERLYQHRLVIYRYEDRYGYEPVPR